MHSLRHFQKGEGRVGSTIMFIILGLAIFIAFKMVPVYINIYAFEDAVKVIGTEHGGRRQPTEASILDAILDEAKRNDLSVHTDQITVSLRRKFLSINVQYSTSVKFPGYTWKKNVEVKYDGKRFR